MIFHEWIQRWRCQRVTEENGRKVEAAIIEAMRQRADELEERLRQIGDA